MVLKYEDIQPTCPAPGITRRILAHGGGMMGVEASFQKGAVGEAHRHPHEQVSYILSGCFEYEVEGQKYILHKGDSYYVASRCSSPGRGRNSGHLYSATDGFSLNRRH